ncbi:hypothetical protein BJ170DRAFT_585399, partial [Xylariales sp. AK1849]
GSMRLNECEQVKETLQEHLGINLTVLDGAELFLSCLEGIREPEKTREVSREIFIDLFEKEAIRIENEAKDTPNAGKVSWFLQGMLYPDVIESLSFKVCNFWSCFLLLLATRMGAPEIAFRTPELSPSLPIRVITDPRCCSKDDVRNLGRRLQIHEDLVNRHPFPGPGIGVRVLGEITVGRVEIARKADYIFVFISMIKEAGIYNEGADSTQKMSQAYAGLDTNKAVGVMAGTRVYGYIVILRAVTTSDFMSAEPHELPFALLKAIARRFANEVDGVSRVTYDLSSKPPGTLELEQEC